MREKYVATTDDWYVRFMRDNWKDFKKAIKDIRVERNENGDYTFSDIDALRLYIYDETKYNVDWWMDGSMYIEKVWEEDLLEEDVFDKNIDWIMWVPLDKKECFSLNPTFKIREKKYWDE